MKNGIQLIVVVFAMAILFSCKVPYTPPAITSVTNYLVVEGFINIADSTYVKLSRTVNLSSASALKPELKAVITIESSNGSSYSLTDLGNGSYVAAPLNLSSANQYRLRIKTANNEQYLSDFNQTKLSPPIDSVNFVPTTDLKIYVSTHDPNNATHYYRWDFTEAWEFHPNFNSAYISNGLAIGPRAPSAQIWDCYTGDNSTNITLGTSVQLSRDVINQQLINTIAQDAEKISVKYTIGVTQYALTPDAYTYWTLLKTNTEQLGSIFDAQPSAAIGNIHCLNNPAEVVIGYVSAGTVTNSRIFITKQQLPRWIPTPYYPECGADSLDCCVTPPMIPPTSNEYVNFNSPQFLGYEAIQIPITPIYKNGAQVGWLAAAPYCVDCTLRGSKTPPSYWK